MTRSLAYFIGGLFAMVLVIAAHDPRTASRAVAEPAGAAAADAADSATAVDNIAAWPAA